MRLRRWLITTLCGLLCLSMGWLSFPIAPPPPVEAQIGDPPLPVASNLTERPRLLITPAYLEQTLRPRADSDAPAWQALLTYVNSSQPEADLDRYPVEAMRSLAIAALVTEESGYTERAERALLTLVARLQAHPAMQAEVAVTDGAASVTTWDSDFLDWLTGVALGYDWLHDTLSPADRAALMSVMLQATAILNDPARDSGLAYQPTPEATYRFIAYHHEGVRLVWALTAVGLALQGETPEAAPLIDYARTLFTNWILPALDDQPGGAWGEGIGSGFIAHWASVQTATAWWTANRENYFAPLTWWYDRLAYNLMFRYPAAQTSPDGARFMDYPAVFGDTPRQSEIALFGRAQDMLLTTIYSGTEYAAWMAWFLAQGDVALTGRMAVEEFLWRDPQAEGFAPQWRFWNTGAVGHVTLRSALTDSSGALDENATYITFQAGDRFAERQFYAQGSLTVWRAGDELLVHSGVVSDSGDSDSDANYYGRTIASNAPMICDLREDFRQIRPNAERGVWLNDCGQRAIGSAINPYYRADNPAVFETGTILRFAEEGGLDYLLADLTPAYNSLIYTRPDSRPKVDLVTREVVYIRPGTLVIYDRISPGAGAYTPLLRFHFNTPPQAAGTWWRVAGETSQLHIAEVHPNWRAQIGEGYEVAGEMLPFVPNQTESQPSGAHYLQFVVEEWSYPTYAITLMIADDLNTAPPTWQYVTGDGLLGVAWGGWQVMFDDDPGDITSGGFDVQAGVVEVFITGLTPLAAYDITLPDGSQQELLADSAGTLYIFMDSAGLLRLERR